MKTSLTYEWHKITEVPDPGKDTVVLYKYRASGTYGITDDAWYNRGQKVWAVRDDQWDNDCHYEGHWIVPEWADIVAWAYAPNVEQYRSEFNELFCEDISKPEHLYEVRVMANPDTGTICGISTYCGRIDEFDKEQEFTVEQQFKGGTCMYRGIYPTNDAEEIGLIFNGWRAKEAMK